MDVADLGALRAIEERVTGKKVKVPVPVHHPATVPLSQHALPHGAGIHQPKVLSKKKKIMPQVVKRPVSANVVPLPRRGTGCTNPHNPAWKHYGGRGIEFLFQSFEQFFVELGLRPAGKLPSGHPLYSLDRKDVNGHYEPGNIGWVSWSVQRRNQRPRKRVAA